MNVFYRMGDDARPALPAIEQASLQGIYPAEYVNRLVEQLSEKLKN
jgi:hypothetical protein